jgi:ribulose bisphosphate carboxylase small subunit
MSYFIPPAFLDALSLHITKNFLELPNVRVPLIMGVHGRKGEGKSFMCELVFKRMGMGVIYMSAGELESPDAGDPARLIRLRYREAGEWSKINGRMSVLMINDIDAGSGRLDAMTQYTVNTQLVHGTLMNIADNPTNVQLPGSYDAEPTRRVPIVVTGNDFSTLYAPLLRDGRMEKFYWNPTRSDRLGILSGIFESNEVSPGDLEALIDTFPDQAIDFFGALRSRLYDEQVRRLISDVGIDKISRHIVNSAKALDEFRKPDFSLSHLIEVGHRIVQEQTRIHELNLARGYLPSQPGQPSTPQPMDNSPDAKRESGRSRTYAHEPNGSAAVASPAPTAPAATATATADPALAPAIAEQLVGMIRQGFRVGIEITEPRRFRINSWSSYATLEGNEKEAIAQLKACLAENPRQYIRLVAIQKGDRRRVAEQIVYRPG